MVNLCLIGLNKSLTTSLGIALKNRAKDVCMLSDVGSADVALVDVDDIQDEDQWRKPQQEHNLVLIAISEKDRLSTKYSKEFSALLKKPLQFSALLSAISSAAKVDHQKLSNIQTAKKAAAQVSDSTRLSVSTIVREKDLIDAEDYLLGRVLSAIKSSSDDQYRLIQWWSGDKWLLIDKQENKVFLNIEEKKLRRVAFMKLDTLSVEEGWVSSKRAKTRKEKSIWECSTEDFVWLLTHYTVRTGGLKSLSLDTPYRLKQWPNLARYSANEKDLPLSSCWIDGISTVNDLAEKISLPMDKVLPFASCCLAIGFIGEEEAPKQSEATPEPPKKKGLKKVFSMILSKLAA